MKEYLGLSYSLTQDSGNFLKKCLTQTQKDEFLKARPNCTGPVQKNHFRKPKNAQNGAKPSSGSPNSANTNPKGGNRTWRIFLDLYLRNDLFLKIEKGQKQCFKRLPEPELRNFEPEGGKADQAHLSGPPSKKLFFSEDRKTPKTGPKQAPGAQTPKIRTRRGETGPGASF